MAHAGGAAINRRQHTRARSTVADSQFRTNHHYVPESYLRRWAGADGRLFVYRLLVSHPIVRTWEPKTPRGVARHRHLYTRAAAGSESDEIERWLDREFEAPASAAIGKAISGMRLTAEDYVLLARFVAAQDVRTPARLVEILERGREHVSETLQDSVDRAARELEAIHAAGGSLKGDATVNHNGLPVRVRIEPNESGSSSRIRAEMVVGRGYWQFALRQLLSNTVKHLQAHRWAILRAPKGINWLTSDDPVIKLNRDRSGAYDFRGGWGSAGTEIMLPLDTRNLFYTQVGVRPPPRGTVLDVSAARAIERFIVEHAHRYVFAMQPDAVVERLRPQTVDAELFQQEAAQWRRWHNEQSAAERELGVR